jgi:hypothetical protein
MNSEEEEEEEEFDDNTTDYDDGLNTTGNKKFQFLIFE